MRHHIALMAALACAACTPAKDKAPPAAAEPEANDILHITAGGIAMADSGEAKRHWAEYTINLIDGSQAYGWTSEKTISFPHTLNFELAGPGRIDALVLDSTFAPVKREDGSESVSADGSPVRRFTVLGSLASAEGPYFKIYSGEAARDERSLFKLDKPVTARWLRLVVESNWAGSGQTRLSEFEAQGELEQKGAGGVADVSGYYTHEYGPIVLRQDGDHVRGCYNNGSGRLEGVIHGRVMRLGWYEAGQGSVGAATLVAAKDQLYGFWYREGDKMGSPWNAVKAPAPAGADKGACAGILKPQ